MDILRIYYHAFDNEEPFEGKEKHQAANFLITEILFDIFTKLNNHTGFLKAQDGLDNLYFKLAQNKIDMDDFFTILFMSQQHDVDKYLFTFYGKNTPLFSSFYQLYKANKRYIEKFGIDKYPLNLNPAEISYSVDFYTLLNYENLKKAIEKANLNNEQKDSLIMFFDSMKKKSQFAYDKFDFDLAEGFSPRNGLKILYESLLNYSDLTFVNEILDSIVNFEIEQKQTTALITQMDRSVEVLPVLQESEFDRINPKDVNLIREFVVGQNHAIDKIYNMLMAASIGLRNPNKPICSLLFDGPTGVGKTEAAKAIARACFNGKIHVEDMTQFKHKTDLSRLTGSTAGFVGYNDTPAIVKFLSENSSGVLLFDEVDKCDPGCLDVLMRILDEGEFITAKGDVFSTKNMVVVCTTNMNEYIAKSVGFSTPEKEDHAGKLAQNNAFRKELLGRFSGVINFDKLTREDCVEIGYRYLQNYAGWFNENHIRDNVRLQVGKSFVEDVIDETQFKTLGARIVCSTLQKYFDETVINYYMQSSDFRNKHLIVEHKNDVREIKGKKQVIVVDTSEKTE